MKPLLVVIDMQRDFITGTLGTPEAQAIVPAVCQRIQAFPGDIVYTRDTHDENYLSTQEGKHLPVAHCLRGTPGWEILPGNSSCRGRKNRCDLGQTHLCLYRTGGFRRSRGL